MLKFLLFFSTATDNSALSLSQTIAICQCLLLLRQDVRFNDIGIQQTDGTQPDMGGIPKEIEIGCNLP